MQSDLGDTPPMVKTEYPISVRPAKRSRKKTPDNFETDGKDEDDQGKENASNQLVIYDPAANSTTQDLIPVSDHNENYTSSFQNLVATNPASRVLPSVGAFTVQCATCFKWRLIPTKEKYEEIREHILQSPFTCERARGWRPDVSCDDPADISQDGSRLWAIDKPNIAQPPPGWERQLRIRGEGSTKFADVYYAAPSGKKLRSMVEIQKYLFEHPEYVEQGVKLSQFSFQTPRPLQENYVRKRSARTSNAYDGAGFGLPRPLEPDEVNPLSWAEPPTYGDLQISGPGLPPPCLDRPVCHQPLLEPLRPRPRSGKKKTTKPSSKTKVYITSSSSSPVYHPPNNFEDSPQARNASSYEL